SFGRPDSANLYPQRSPIRGRICERGTENTRAGDFGCSGGDTQKKIMQAILRCSEKCTKLASSAATITLRGNSERAHWFMWISAHAQRLDYCRLPAMDAVEDIG